MNRLPKDYVERVYAGWLGKVIGVRHGACIEGWKAEQIREKYGEITQYIYPNRFFRPDDDTNGPIFLIRALEDYGSTEDISPQEMGLTLLNYAAFERGFYWWGGYSKSTPHTAYLNLYHGAQAPDSGSSRLNGLTASEQICGQIFIDSWGLVNPGDYRRAARYAQKMASVTHDGEGVYGGMFIAACISAAFEDRDIYSVIKKGLSIIPETSTYARVVRDLSNFHKQNPDNFLDALAYSLKNYGYDRYKGTCHILPNAGVVLVALLYGGGDFSRSVNIAAMCGEDTDCNVGNVGSIMGVLCGLDGIDYKTWREPLNDFLVTASTMGSMNLRDIANDALYLAGLGCKIAGEDMPEPYNAQMKEGQPRYHFGLPGSTHSFFVDGMEAALENQAGIGLCGSRALRVSVAGASGKPIRLTRKTYFRRSDFGKDMTIYYPSFAPEVLPGQRLESAVKTEVGGKARLFAHDLNNNIYYYGMDGIFGNDGWAQLSLNIPGGDALIDSIGVEFETPDGHALDAVLDHMGVSGGIDYCLNFNKSGMEVWSFDYAEVAQCSTFKGKWQIEGEWLHGSCADRGELYFGSQEMKDYELTACLCPMYGQNHYLLMRVQGAVRSYAAGFGPNNKLKILKNSRGYTELAACSFPWELGKKYSLTCRAEGHSLTVFVDGREVLAFTDNEQPYIQGAAGAAMFDINHCDYSKVRLRSL